MILELIVEARASGARLGPCCEVVELDVRTVQRWLKHGPDGGEDGRRGPRKPPANKLTPQERQEVLDVVNAPEFVDLSPHQIVPKLADIGIYIASESTIYRLMREENLNAHRGRARAPTRHRPDEHTANAPNQVWCWDITYLYSPIAGQFYFLYLFLDIWSRKIVGWDVLEEESNESAAKLFRDICKHNDVDPKGLVLHSDNGGPMKGATMLATLQKLGVVTSFSRPHVSDDNPYAEALFRTAKYRPSYPDGPFAPKRLHAEFAEGVHVAVVGSGVSLVRGGAVARWTWDGSKDRAAVEPAAGGSGHEFRGRQPRRGRSAGVGARVEIMTGAS